MQGKSKCIVIETDEEIIDLNIMFVCELCWGLEYGDNNYYLEKNDKTQ
jgi:hypothetical protein